MTVYYKDAEGNVTLKPKAKPAEIETDFCGNPLPTKKVAAPIAPTETPDGE